MKLTLERAALLNALSHIQSAVERRNTIPILANVLLEADGAKLSLTATDLDLAVIENAAANIGAGGATTVPAHTFYDIVRKLPDGVDIELAYSTKDQRLSIKAGRSSFQLSCLPREDFPVMATGELPHRFQIAAADLVRLIDKTRFAISTEETRYYLNGIFIHAASSGGAAVLRAVATDGHRLARVEVPLPQGAAGMPGVILPRKTVNELRKLIEGADALVQVQLSETKIRFAFDDVVLVSKLIDGTFPDYERVIPTGNDKRMEVENKPFAAAVDRVSTISMEKNRAVKLSLDRDKLLLSATSPEQGNASEEIVVSYGATGLEIGFNARYLLDITGQIHGDKAEFILADAAAPTLVKDSGDQHVLYVLMPMRV